MKKRIPSFLLVIAMMIYMWCWCGEQFYALEAHRLQWGQDFAFFQRILNSAVAGGEWTSSLLLEPTGFFSMVHFHPVLAVIVPLWALFSTPKLLLAINVLAVVATAWPLARIGSKQTNSSVFGLCCGVAWLVWLPAHGAAIADFRPMVFLIPGLACVVAGAMDGSKRWLLFGAVLCCMAREEASYLLVVAGLVLSLFPLGGGRRSGLALVGVGAVWFGFLLVFKENFFFHFNPVETIRGFGSGASVPPELTDARIGFVRSAWLGGYLAAPLSLNTLGIGGGAAAWLFTDTHREWHAITGTVVYLKDPLVVIIAAAGTLGAGILVRKRPSAALLVGLVMIISNQLSYSSDRSRLKERMSSLRDEAESEEVLEIDRLISSVPKSARVATDYRLIADFADRAVLWNVAHLYMEDAPPPHWEDDWPLTLELLDTVVLPIDDPFVDRLSVGWGLVDQGGGYGVWLREG
jgi:hypothetical protein